MSRNIHNTGLMVLVSLSVHGPDRRQAAIKKVKELDGTVEIDKEKPESATLKLSLMDCKVSDTELGFVIQSHGIIIE